MLWMPRYKHRCQALAICLVSFGKSSVSNHHLPFNLSSIIHLCSCRIIAMPPKPKVTKVATMVAKKGDNKMKVYPPQSPFQLRMDLWWWRRTINETDDVQHVSFAQHPKHQDGRSQEAAGPHGECSFLTHDVHCSVRGQHHSDARRSSCPVQADGGRDACPTPWHVRWSEGRVTRHLSGGAICYPLTDDDSASEDDETTQPRGRKHKVR